MLTAAAAHADMDSYMTTGTNDTVRISPHSLGNYVNVMVRGVFQGRTDYWSMTITYLGGLTPIAIIPGPDMTVPYKNANGLDTCCTAQFHYHNSYSDDPISTVWGKIDVPGYWDSNNDGTYETYGTVKWEAGTHRMFNLSMEVSQNFTQSTILISGYLNPGMDMRGGTTGYVVFQRTVRCIVGYEIGDVNGDEYINIADLMLLTDYLLTEGGLDQYQLDAADVDRDGVVGFSDVTALTTILSGSVHLNGDEGLAE